MIEKRCYIPLVVAFLILLIASCFGTKALLYGKGQRVLYSSTQTSAQAKQ